MIIIWYFCFLIFGFGFVFVFGWVGHDCDFHHSFLVVGAVHSYSKVYTGTGSLVFVCIYLYGHGREREKLRSSSSRCCEIIGGLIDNAPFFAGGEWRVFFFEGGGRGRGKCMLVNLMT